MSLKKRLNKPESITIGYALLGIVWIWGSDLVTNALFSDDINQLAVFQLFKGIFYVLITSYLLYYLIKRLYDQVNERNRELEILFTNPDLGIFKLNETGQFTEVSPNIQKITGFNQKELLGKSFLDFTPENQQKSLLDQINSISQNSPEKGFMLRYQFLSKDQKLIHLNIFGIQLLDTKKEKIAYIATFQNTTPLIHSLETLSKKNQQLQELAYDQSHLVRAPLARILAITSLFEDESLISESDQKALIRKLEISAQDLDNQIRKLSKKMVE
ncbi:PAS domain-containing protein [Algoriphagus sanaruensis]|uniref:PAS domain-containing protein n=1 Tax=Algoriphagus sanaruensis TaxID=1727163 RepID=A0A142ES20_9BACT|nr:PAS domain-containing protein [Algoriphagus sanaruensis]AMQ57925.1 hypothetical protein AO498_15835 [Algoriphagus sanaruensis]